MVEVIGLARDAKGSSLFDPPPLQLYVPLRQNYMSEMTLHLRTSGEPEQMIAAVRESIHEIDRSLPVDEVRALSQQFDNALATQRLSATLISGFGLLALALAMIGLYGVISYTVAEGTREIGIRMALGAQIGDVLKQVIGQGMKLALAGVAIGLVAALALTRLLKGMLFGVSATDPLTFVSIVLLLMGIAMLACYFPSRRATKVDPTVALRYE